MRKKKELSIIGSNYFNFKLEIEKDIDEYIDIDCTCEIFCIHKDFLIPYGTNIYNDYKNDEHYFSNCDCNQTNECYYNRFYLEKNWRKLDLEGYKRLITEAENKRNEKEEIRFAGAPSGALCLQQRFS